MGMLGKLVRGGIAAKALQIAQRELRKPENQKRIGDAVTKLRSRGRPARP